MVCYFFRQEIKEIEQVFFKIECLIEVLADKVFLSRIIVTVSFQDIFEPASKGNHLVMADPFVGIKNHLFGSENTLIIEVGSKFF